MTLESQSAYDAIVRVMDAEFKRLGNLDYRDALWELEATVKSRIEAMNEEMPE